MKPISSLSVAGQFIDNSFSEGLRLTNMQVQKMVYIANGLYLALKGEPLIKEDVEAWNYGPVIPILYNELKEYGSGYITTNLLTLYSDPIPSDNQDLEKVLQFTWNACKNTDGIKLSNWTHAPDSPWTKALNDGRNVIPNEFMIDYFKRFLKQPVNA